MFTTGVTMVWPSGSLMTPVLFNYRFSLIHLQCHYSHSAGVWHHPDRGLQGRGLDQTVLRLWWRQHLDDDLHGAIFRLWKRTVFFQVSINYMFLHVTMDPFGQPASWSVNDHYLYSHVRSSVRPWHSKLINNNNWTFNVCRRVVYFLFIYYFYLESAINKEIDCAL